MAKTRTSAKTAAAIGKVAAPAGDEETTRAGAKAAPRARGKAAASGAAKQPPGRGVAVAQSRGQRATDAPGLAQSVAASAHRKAAEGVAGFIPRSGSRIAAVIGMLREGRGATIGELVAATGWLAHTMRAALTGLRRKGLVIERTRDGEGASRYRIVDAAPARRSV